VVANTGNFGILCVKQLLWTVNNDKWSLIQTEHLPTVLEDVIMLQDIEKKCRNRCQRSLFFSWTILCDMLQSQHKFKFSDFGTDRKNIKYSV